MQIAGFRARETGEARQELTQRDPGGGQQEAGQTQTPTQQAEHQVAEQQVDATLQEGVEGRAGSGRQQQAARQLEQKVVEQFPRVDDPSDVAVVQTGTNKLEAEFSRSAQVDMAAESIDLKQEVVRSAKRDRRPKGQGVTPGAPLSPVAEELDVGDIDEVTLADSGDLDVTLTDDFVTNAEPVGVPEAEPVLPTEDSGSAPSGSPDPPLARTPEPVNPPGQSRSRAWDNRT